MASPGLKILFAGTPEFAAHHLQALLDDGRHQVLAVYTQPDRPAGRGKKLQASPVKEIALSAGLDIQQPATLKSTEAQATLAAYRADVMVVVAYGLLLPAAVLAIPPLGCVNVHASLLPRWRGAAPIQRAIEAGDTESGITIMQMDVGLDTGPMLLTQSCPILPQDTAQDLHDRLAELGPEALLEALNRMQSGNVAAQEQDGSLATYAHKLTKEEALIDWRQPAEQINRRIRAFNPYPVAFTLLNNENLRIFAAEPRQIQPSTEPGTVLAIEGELVIACGGGTALALQVVQLPGKKVMPVRDLLNGLVSKIRVGSVLGI